MWKSIERLGEKLSVKDKKSPKQKPVGLKLFELQFVARSIKVLKLSAKISEKNKGIFEETLE